MEETVDLKFSVDGKLVYAHKSVLTLSSDYYRRMFENDWAEKADLG